jgi:ubiquinone/menaquinone biosynthesis C-methylase UbiE
MGIRIKELKGKRVLDLGGIIGGNTQLVFKENEVDIVPVNIDYLHSKHGGILALAQELPLSANSFDLVFSYSAIPAYLEHSLPEFKITLEEALRVLKSGCKAYFFPIIESCIDSKFLDTLKSLKDIKDSKLEELGSCEFDNLVGKKQEKKVFRLELRKI